jgi:two-component system, chemotaxis family, protein-glutamate methylesterase/glutaminase
LLRREIVMIGVSAGGLDALCRLLGDLPADLRLALVIVQHRSKESEALCEVLAHCSVLPVEEVVDKATISEGHVYLAPPDYHLLVEDGFFSLSLDAPELFSRPSIDVAFESAADAYAGRAIGVVLTGANHDGARGLRRIFERGGYAIVQDPATAEVAVMPAAALRSVPTAEVATLESLPALLVELDRQGTPTREGR